MKLKMLLLAVFVTGAFASFAIAKPPPGKGNGETESTSATNAAPGKVLVCHKVGNGKYVLLSVSAKSSHARLKRAGDVLAIGRTCPGPIQGHGGTTTTTP